jgi:general secretion pathway protein J
MRGRNTRAAAHALSAYHRGFTLIEMTVALAVMSMIMLATVTALRTLGSTQVSLDRLTQRNDEIRSVSAFLRDAMELAVVSSKRRALAAGGVAEKPSIFEVTSSSIVWTTALRFGEGVGGSYVARVAQEDDAAVLRWQLPDARVGYGDWNKAPARTLVTDVESLSVDYRREYGDAWLSETAQGEAPGWVRVRIEAGGRFWPDIVMQVPR